MLASLEGGARHRRSQSNRRATAGLLPVSWVLCPEYWKRAEHDPGRGHAARKTYLRCFETSAVISNMLTCFLPLNTAFSTSSALIMRLLVLSWRPFFLM